MRHKFVLLAVIAVLLAPVTALAQQTGAIAGRAVDSSGGALPGVTVEATSPSLPSARVAVTGANGDYRLAALPPGTYAVTFTLSGMQTLTRNAQVQLQQDTTINVTMAVSGVAETVNVVATASYVDTTAATIKSGVSAAQISALPVGQDYRDLVRLIPGVQLTADVTRGPSAGGSGQDNVYQFDGVNVTLPLFGVLSSEPSTHDIAQMTTVRGGARAIDFDRSGGLTIDTVSKSGTNRLSGELSFKTQPAKWAADLGPAILSQYEQDSTWTTGSIGGRLLPGKAFFYGSYFRPEFSRGDRTNNYGALPDFERERNEFFGKLTLTPIRDVLLNVSYRESKREDVSSSTFLASSGPQSGSGSEEDLKIATADGSWILGRGLATFKYTRFSQESLGRPDFVSTATPSDVIGSTLDIANLTTQGRVTLPLPIATNPAFNTLLTPFINQYGYINASGVRTGGGIVGYGSQFNDQDFYRDNIQLAYNVTLGSTVSHELHVGYQWYKDSEELIRSSNGWGEISLPLGRTSFNGQPISYTARYQRQSAGYPAIVSDYKSQSVEFNDMIRWNNWTFNAGVIVSNDKLYGQGLRESGSGFVGEIGHRYLMHEIPWKKMIQPRLSIVRSFNGADTVYASFARYNPANSSLPRAASWDRNLITTFLDAHFDAAGRLFATVPVNSSTGKLFADDLTPRTTDEFLLGTSMEMAPSWTARVYGRYRHSRHFWEDTQNNSRIALNPPADVPRTLYIPDLAAKLTQIGSTANPNTAYVIAELDGAYTKFYEATVESEYSAGKVFVRGSYTWSHYFGNMDQDNSATANDAAVFIGSSNIADGGGRQIWDNKEGDLRGDRRHIVKVYGYYSLPWQATIGAYALAQSGHPWEAWNHRAYPVSIVGTSTSDLNRYAEPAGSRLTDAHYQIDLNYTQSFNLAGRATFQLEVQAFNLFNKQTGYNPEPSQNNSNFGNPRSFFAPRRMQLGASLKF